MTSRGFSCLRPRITTTRQLVVPHRRWASYDREGLDVEALRQRMQAGLRLDDADDSTHINLQSKTVSTPAGDLPASPLFDPEWVKTRRRATKADRGMPSGRFRKKLSNNPYARALASPIRKCANTSTSLPRYFLQDFELVKHPEEDSLWWAPGSLSFDGVNESKPVPNDAKDEKDATRPSHESPKRREGPRSPITSYTLARKSVIDRIGGSNKKHAALLLAVRTGMAVSPDTRDAVWRRDMGDALLGILQRRATDAISSAQEHITACDDWSEVGKVNGAGCVLWFPDTDAPATQYATHDSEGAKYGSKLAVHNLRWTLGKEEAERLQGLSKLFQGSRVLVLRLNKETRGLQMLLWKLQGYLAKPV